MQYCLGRVMIWKKNVQFAKQSTPLLTLNLSIAVMLALKKLAGQSKKIQLGKSQFLGFRASANLRLQTIIREKNSLHLCCFQKCFFFQFLAVVTEVMGWSADTFLDDDAGILFAFFVVVPSVRFSSLNIFAHPSSSPNIVWGNKYFWFMHFYAGNILV